MPALVDPLIYQSRPEFRVGGEDRPELGDRLVALQVEDTQDGLANCEATFVNWGISGEGIGFLYLDRRILEFGRRIEITAGGGVGSGPIFDGRIMAIEGRYLRERPHEVMVLAEDRLQDLRMTRRTRTFAQVSDADVFRRVAGEHGLRTDIDVSGPTHVVLAQVNQSDLAFLRERARTIDAELWVTDDTLFVAARSRRNAGDVVLTFGRGLMECAITADLAHQVSGVVVSGWNVAAKEAIRERAAQTSLAGELGNDTGGSQVLLQALGKEHDEQIVHVAPLSTEEARCEAEAQYRRRARRFLTGTAVAEGDARLRVGARVALRNLGPLFDGPYYVSRVLHLFDRVRGFQTQFTVNRPGIGA